MYSTFDYLTNVIVSIDYANCFLYSRLIYIYTFGNPYASRVKTEFHSNVDEKAAWIVKNVLKPFYWLVKHLFDACIKKTNLLFYFQHSL